MKKVAIMLATVATLAAVATAPAEARGRHFGNASVAAGLITGAVVAAAVADQYGYGPAYYGPHYYGGPVYIGGYHPYRYW